MYVLTIYIFMSLIKPGDLITFCLSGLSAQKVIRETKGPYTLVINDQADHIFDRSPVGMTYWNVQV